MRPRAAGVRVESLRGEGGPADAPHERVRSSRRERDRRVVHAGWGGDAGRARVGARAGADERSRARLVDVGIRRAADGPQPERDRAEPLHRVPACTRCGRSRSPRSPTTAPVLASAVDVDGTSTDMVYAGDRTGEFYGVNAATGQQVWSRDLGDPHVACGGLLGVTDTALIDRSRNVLYVAGSDGWLYALDLATGADAPGWPLQVAPFDNEYVWGGINMFDDQLYRVGGERLRPVRPQLRQGRPRGPGTATQTAVFYVTGGPDTGVSGGGVWGWGGASIDPADGNVYIATANGYPLDPVRALHVRGERRPADRRPPARLGQLPRPGGRRRRLRFDAGALRRGAPLRTAVHRGEQDRRDPDLRPGRRRRRARRSRGRSRGPG